MKKLSYEEIEIIQHKICAQNTTSPVCALLENIRSLYNVGSMFRTADAAGIEALYITGYTGTPPRKEIEKTALGSTSSVRWYQYADPADAVTHLKAAGYMIAACEHTDESVDYREDVYKTPLCLMFGNEVDGLSDTLCEMADISLLIPMYGMKKSLNVSVAFGIAVYQAVHVCRVNDSSHLDT